MSIRHNKWLRGTLGSFRNEKYEVTEVAFRAGSDWEMNFFGYVHTLLLTFLVPTHIKYHFPTPSLLQTRAITKTAGGENAGENTLVHRI